jgi:hypothetical protein
VEVSGRMTARKLAVFLMEERFSKLGFVNLMGILYAGK